jgi:hypothetical protein
VRIVDRQGSLSIDRVHVHVAMRHAVSNLSRQLSVYPMFMGFLLNSVLAVGKQIAIEASLAILNCDNLFSSAYLNAFKLIRYVFKTPMDA